MTSARWATIDALFHAALERRSDERPAFLDAACAGDETLRQEVESLLGHERVADRFLERPALHLAAQRLASEVNLSPPDPQIPGYTILKALGEGGMGVVYLAEQVAPIHRQVALKLIKHGMDSRQVLARFDVEQQTLALMRHPHIAAVFDAGTTNDGRPYFVMEYVDGVPITEYCDRHRLSTRDRLELFIDVCTAVQHAHQKGVIHRDLKPSNVLVSHEAGHPVPKIIDFGVAKAIERSLIGRTVFTEQGVLVGTPEYMSPEQAALSPDIDTSTDVYSLGVLLYELLVGVLPFDPTMLRAAGHDEMRRVIRESDPPKPSARLTTTVLTANVAAAARQTDAGRLSRQLKGDLDWITLKALEKDRRHRYSTVAEFSADVAHYLADEPIAARPPSAVYRIRKFTRRYRGMVLGAAAVLVALIAGLTASLMLYARAESQRVEADRQRSQADIQRAAAEAAARDAAAQRSAAVAATDEANRQRVTATNEAASALEARREAEYRAYAATIAAADGELRSNAPVTARARLLTVPEEQREWEWRHLFLRTDTSLRTLKADTPCRRPREEVFVSSDQVLAIGKQGESLFLRRCATLEVWDTRTFAHAVHPAPPGTTILAVGDSERIVISRVVERGVWDAQVLDQPLGARPVTLGPWSAEPRCADLSPDGKKIAIGFPLERDPVTGVPHNDVFELWDAETGRRLHRLIPPAPPARDKRNDPAVLCATMFSADGGRWATSGAAVTVWDVESGSLVLADRTLAGFVSQPIAFNHDGTRLAVGRANGLVDVLDATSQSNTIVHLRGDEFSPQLEQRLTEVLSVAYSPDDSHLVTSMLAGVGLWSIPEARLIRRLNGHSAPVIGVAISQDSGSVFSADNSGAVKQWSIEDSAAMKRVPPLETPLHHLAASLDGTVAADGLDGSLNVWRPFEAGWRNLRPGSGRADIERSVTSLAFTPDSRYLLAAETDKVNGTLSGARYILVGPPFVTGAIGVWAIASGDRMAIAVNQGFETACQYPREETMQRPGDVTLLAVSPDGRFTAHQRGVCVIVRDFPSTKLEAVLQLKEVPTALSFRPDGTLLVAAAERLYPYPTEPQDATIRLWDWRTNRVLATVASPWKVRNGFWLLVSSADGSRVAMWAGLSPSKVSIWDGALTHELGRLPADDVETLQIAISPNGHRIATANRGNLVRVWDADRLQPLLTLTDTEGHFMPGVLFTNDGRLIAARASGGLTIWESQKRQPLPNR